MAKKKLTNEFRAAAEIGKVNEMTNKEKQNG